MKVKNKKKLQDIANNFWFLRLYKRLSNRHLCPKCLKNPKDKETPKNWCFHCYYQSLTKTKYRARNKKLKGGKKKMTENKDTTTSTENKTFEATCMKCKKQVIVEKPELVKIKGKGNSTRDCVKGICPECKKGVFRILKKV